MLSVLSYHWFKNQVSDNIAAIRYLVRIEYHRGNTTISKAPPP